MSKKDKALDRLRENPKNVRFEEIDKILKWYGFTFTQASKGTSHFVYTLKIEQKFYRLVIPFKRPFVKRRYIENALQILDELETGPGSIVEPEDE